MTATIVVTDVVEHEDGSATYTFDMDKGSINKLVELGVQFTLTCAAYGVDTQDALDLIAKQHGVTHVTPADGDVFEDLGVSKE